jgi:MscS family membrane protein
MVPLNGKDLSAREEQSATVAQFSSTRACTRHRGDSFLHYLESIKINDAIGAILVLLGTVFFHVLVVGRFFRVVERRVQQRKWLSKASILHRIRRPVVSFVFLAGLMLMAQFFLFTSDARAIANRLFHALTLGLATWTASAIGDTLFFRLSQRLLRQNSEYYGILPLLNRCFRGIIIAIGALFLIDAFGYSVGGIFATLGVGGALVALAAKDSIANVFSSLSIILDRPFKVGDWICVGTGAIEGNVEQIGLRSTRIRTFAKTLMVVPNGILAAEVINNYSCMPYRRVKQLLYIDPGTDPISLGQFVDAVEALILSDCDVARELTFCSLSEFDAASLQIMIYYFTVATDLKSHMAVRNRINRQILKIARQLAITPSASYGIRPSSPPGESVQFLDQ